MFSGVAPAPRAFLVPRASVFAAGGGIAVSGHVTRKLSSVQRGPSLLLTVVVLKSPLDGPLDSLSRGKQ